MASVLAARALSLAPDMMPQSECPSGLEANSGRNDHDAPELELLEVDVREGVRTITVHHNGSNTAWTRLAWRSNT